MLLAMAAEHPASSSLSPPGPMRPALAVETRPAPDLLTLMAIGVTAYFLAIVIHEALGHGLAALLVGLHPSRVTSVDLEVSFAGAPMWKMRLVSAAGCIANGVAAGVALALWPRARRWTAPSRFFLWLFATVSILVPGGYLLALSLPGIGDWGQFVQGLAHPLAWKLGLTVLGLIVSVAGLRWGAAHLNLFLPPRPARRRWNWRMVLSGYLSGGVAAVIAGALNPTSPMLILVSAAAGTFGGTSWLLWIAGIAGSWGPSRQAPMPVPRVGRAPGWLAVGAVALILQIAVLGPGLPR